MLKRFLSILFAITVSSSFAEPSYKEFVINENFAEPIYKGFVINGNTVYKWVQIQEVHEYDSNGNEIHSEGFYGDEEWWEYDSHGK